jgi:hypothetical protein
VAAGRYDRLDQPWGQSMSAPFLVAAWLSVGLAYVLVGACRGLYSLGKHEVTVLRPGRPGETKETREVAEFVVTIALTLITWPLFLGFPVFAFFHGRVAARRFRQNPPPWLTR